MYRPYSRPDSPALPNPLLDRASQHRADFEVRGDESMSNTALPPILSRPPSSGVTSPKTLLNRRSDVGGMSRSPPQSSGRNEMVAKSEMEHRREGGSGMRHVEGDGYRPDALSSGNPSHYTSSRRSRSPPPTTYPDSRATSPLSLRGARQSEGEMSRRDGVRYGSRAPSAVGDSVHNSPSTHHAPIKRCFECGGTEAEVGLILPLTEEGGKQFCKGCSTRGRPSQYLNPYAGPESASGRIYHSATSPRSYLPSPQNSYNASYPQSASSSRKQVNATSPGHSPLPAASIVRSPSVGRAAAGGVVSQHQATAQVNAVPDNAARCKPSKNGASAAPPEVAPVAGTCPGDGLCNGTGGKSACEGCPTYNNSSSAKVTNGAEASNDGDDVMEGIEPARAPRGAGSGARTRALARTTSTTSNNSAAAHRMDIDRSVTKSGAGSPNAPTTTLPLAPPVAAAQALSVGLYHKLHGVPRPVAMKKTVIKRRKRVPAVGHPVKSNLNVDELAGFEDRNSEHYQGVSSDASASLVTGPRDSSTPHLNKRAPYIGEFPEPAQDSASHRYTHSLTDSPSPRGMGTEPAGAAGNRDDAEASEREAISRDHQLAAETLLSIGPTAAQRSTMREHLSPLPHGSERSATSMESRGTKRKTPEDDRSQPSSVHGRQGGSPRAGYYGLTSRGWGASNGSVRSIPQDERSLNAREGMESSRAGPKDRVHESDPGRERDREGDKEKDKLVDRRPPGPGSQIAQQSSSRQMGHSAATARPPSRGSYINAPGYGYHAQRSGNFKYGALFGTYDGADPSRNPSASATANVPGNGQKLQLGSGPTAQPASRTNPNSSWANPYPSASNNPATSAMSGSAATSNTLLRKELLDHRDHLMDNKRWLETNLAKTERLLNQVNDRLAESVAASSSVNLGIARASSTLIGRERLSAEEEIGNRARAARERGDHQQTWSSSVRGGLGGGHGLGSSRLFGLSRGDWDLANKERERFQELEKSRERERDQERERDEDRQRHKSTDQVKESAPAPKERSERTNQADSNPEVVALPRKRDNGAGNPTYRADSFWPLVP
ncbi:hypothetical protein QFC22_001521 [Naganishia vaughanmartiniae]|uniref:Uncharacterized protein n=1 Tax=Naganishia vaughanmartiniae TaxID=1424756 RepID=A0ACC2XHB1_9TREE|nr:hypothetical protein QFC22_001521 [Naganishia vaughanmartiniae]